MATILAIDVGERKIGLAIGNDADRFAFVRPALLVSDWAAAWPLLTQLIAHEQVEKILVGLPLNADGTSGAQAERVQTFVTELGKHVSGPIITRNEHGTSQAVLREQQTHDRALKRGEEDSLAAQLLLESYFQETAQ